MAVYTKSLGSFTSGWPVNTLIKHENKQTFDKQVK